MKKISGLCLALCLLLLLQMFSLSVMATETDESDSTEPAATVPAAAFGTATVASGCRTIDGQVPLGGSDRMLDSAQAAFIYERNTGTVIYSYNPDKTIQPGTFSKIVAAIVAIEHGDLDSEVTVSSRNYKTLPAGVVNAKLKEGEVMTLRDLVYCMFLEWANDAAITVAENVAGSEEEFVVLMNEWVRNAGCTDTKFTNCHGLGSSDQTTTARDLVRIIQEASKNTEFRELFCAKNYEVPATNKSDERNLKSLNYLIEETLVPKYNYDGVTGGIAHYSSASGASLVCTAEDNGLSLTVVVLGCRRTFAANGWTVTYYGNYEEIWDLLDFAFNNYKICRLLHDGQSMSQFTVADGENHVVGQTHTAMDAILPKEAKLDNLILKYSVANGGLTAPITLDQQIATLQIWYRTSCIAETELYAMSSVRSLSKSDLEIQGSTRDDSNLTGLLSFLGSAALVILVLFVIYLVINNVRRAVAMNRRRRRRKNRRRSR